MEGLYEISTIQVERLSRVSELIQIALFVHFRFLIVWVVVTLIDPFCLLFVGQLLASETEREILEILGVPWQEPHERVRANFV